MLLLCKTINSYFLNYTFLQRILNCVKCSTKTRIMCNSLSLSLCVCVCVCVCVDLVPGRVPTSLLTVTDLIVVVVNLTAILIPIKEI